MSTQSLSLAQRMVVGAIGWLERRSYGYRTPFLVEVARSYGAAGTMRVFSKVGAVVKDLDTTLGTEHANLVLGMMGTWNGCPWCGVGHLRAANLLVMARTGAPLPLDEREQSKWREMSFDDLEEHLVRLLDDYPEEAAIVRAAAAVQVDRETDHPHAALIRRAVHAWSLVNDCSVVVTYDMDPAEIPALLPKGSVSAEVRAKYLELRPLRDVS